MRNKVPARFTSVTAMAALISILLMTPVFAQEAAESEESVKTPETADTSNEPTSEPAGAPAVVESGAVLEYEPTESISEDLSVSFPVDI
jgi:hypothetical protein